MDRSYLEARRAAAFDMALKRARYWEAACSRTHSWSLVWPAQSGRVLSLGEDVLRMCMLLVSPLPLAATCKSLRSLLLPRLTDNRLAAERKLLFVL